MIDTNADLRFMSNNLLDTGYNRFEVSSIADDYYQSDLLTQERSRHFKFGGRFLITEDDNDLIYIDAVSYQVPANDYSSPDALATAITTAIAATGVTCTWRGEDNGGEFQFTKASTFTLNATSTVNAIWETIGIIDGVDVVSNDDDLDLTYEVVADMPRFHWPHEEMYIDFGYQAAVGFIGIICDLTQEMKIPEGATVRFLANTVDDFTAPLVDKTLTWTKRGVFGFIDDVDDSAFRYCKLIIEHPEGPIHSEIGYLYVGEYSTFIDRNISIGVGVNFIDTSTISQSDDGQEYANQKTPYRVFTGMAIGLAKPVNVNFLKRLFYLKQKAAPFFVALDPRTQISESIDDMTMFCRFSREPDAKHVLGNNFELSFELKEAL